MSAAGGNSDAATAVAEVRAAREGEILRAAMDAYRRWELQPVLNQLLNTAASWTGAERGFAFGPGFSGRGWSAAGLDGRPVVNADPPVHRIGVHQARALLPDGPELQPGFGSLASCFAAWPEERRPHRTLTVPVRDGDGQPHGVLLLLLAERADPGAIACVDALEREVRPAITHAIQVLGMQQLIIKDDTAACFNRRYFEEFLPEELARASRFRAPLSLIFLDMDGLKRVNTSHGHARGSRALTEVAARIRNKIRKFDKLFRFGGDEFCILLPETEWHGAMEVAERVREAIAGQPFLTRDLGPEGVNMTASLGIAAYPLHARNKQDLIQMADRAQQRIKKTTKNGVAVAEILGDQDD